MQAAIKDVDVVEPSPPISFGAPEDDHVNSEIFADRTVALLPGTILENRPIRLFLGGLPAAESFVLTERLQHAFNFGNRLG